MLLMPFCYVLDAKNTEFFGETKQKNISLSARFIQHFWPKKLYINYFKGFLVKRTDNKTEPNRIPPIIINEKTDSMW